MGEKWKAGQVAVPLLLGRGFVRFMSLVNRRVFSLARGGRWFQLVELEADCERPGIERYLYEGTDVRQLKRVILQEVCDG